MLDFNIYSIYLFIFILLFYLSILSNIFILFLFKLFANIKHFIKELSSINLDPIILFNKNFNTFNLFTHSRNYSTLNRNVDQNFIENQELDSDKTFELDNQNENFITIKEFKKK